MCCGTRSVGTVDRNGDGSSKHARLGALKLPDVRSRIHAAEDCDRWSGKPRSRVDRGIRPVDRGIFSASRLRRPDAGPFPVRFVGAGHHGPPPACRPWRSARALMHPPSSLAAAAGRRRSRSPQRRHRLPAVHDRRVPELDRCLPVRLPRRRVRFRPADVSFARLYARVETGTCSAVAADRLLYAGPVCRGPVWALCRSRRAFLRHRVRGWR